VRSLWIADYVIVFGDPQYSFTSARGELWFHREPSKIIGEGWTYNSYRFDVHHWPLPRGTNALGVHIDVNNPGYTLIPHLFVAMVAGAMCAAPWMRWRFSIRTLLIATAFVATLFGMTAYVCSKMPVAPIFERDVPSDNEENNF
jgi:hypothetical protein